MRMPIFGYGNGLVGLGLTRIPNYSEIPRKREPVEVTKNGHRKRNLFASDCYLKSPWILTVTVVDEFD